LKDGPANLCDCSRLEKNIQKTKTGLTKEEEEEEEAFILCKSTKQNE